MKDEFDRLKDAYESGIRDNAHIWIIIGMGIMFIIDHFHEIKESFMLFFKGLNL